MYDYGKFLADNSEAIFDRLMKKLGFQDNTELAKYLDVKPPAVSGGKKKKIPIDWLIRAHVEEGISIQYLLFGEESKAADIDPVLGDAIELLAQIRKLDKNMYFRLMLEMNQNILELKSKSSAVLYSIKKDRPDGNEQDKKAVGI